MSRFVIPEEKNFTMLPNLLMDHQKELGITDLELSFLIKISRHMEGFKIHDSLLVSGCQKTAQRRRASLLEKKLIRFTQHKESYINDEGKTKWKTIGFTYDLSIINHKIERIFEDKIVQNEDNSVQNQDCDVSNEDNNESVSGQKGPVYNTTNNTNDKTINKSSSRTTTTKVLSDEVNRVYDSYKEYIDPDYEITDADIDKIQKFRNIDKLLDYIKYWKEFTDPYKSNRELTNYEKRTTSKIWLIIDLWNDFKDFAKNKIDSEIKQKEFQEMREFCDEVRSKFYQFNPDNFGEEIFSKWQQVAVSDDEYLMNDFLQEYDVSKAV